MSKLDRIKNVKVLIDILKELQFVFNKQNEAVCYVLDRIDPEGAKDYRDSYAYVNRELPKVVMKFIELNSKKGGKSEATTIKED